MKSKWATTRTRMSEGKIQSRGWDSFSTVFVLLIKLNPTPADLTHYSQLLVVKKKREIEAIVSNPQVPRDAPVAEALWLLELLHSH